jgi:hypothetical protein
MAFEIDTGIAERTPISYLPDWFLDQYREVPDESRAVHDFAFHLVGALHAHDGPKKIETVRKHLIAQWGFLRILADMHPEVFDELLMAYARRAGAFD